MILSETDSQVWREGCVPQIARSLLLTVRGTQIHQLLKVSRRLCSLTVCTNKLATIAIVGCHMAKTILCHSLHSYQCVTIVGYWIRCQWMLFVNLEEPRHLFYNSTVCCWNDSLRKGYVYCKIMYIWRISSFILWIYLWHNLINCLFFFMKKLSVLTDACVAPGAPQQAREDARNKLMNKNNRHALLLDKTGGKLWPRLGHLCAHGRKKKRSGNPDTSHF